MSRWLATSGTLLMLALSGCAADSAEPEPEDAGKPAAEPFALEGAWLYLGPSDGPHNLTISRTTMVYADVDGQWSSSWNIKAYDNVLHHFQVTFGTGSGAYLPVGQSMSGAYDVSGSLLSAQLANGDAYPQLESPGTCTAVADGNPAPDCRLYVKH